MKPILTFGSIFWVNTLVDFVLGRQGDLLFLSNLLPDSSQAGLYDVAYSVAQLATLVTTVGLAGVSFATFAKLAVTNQETMDRFYAFSIRMISLLTIPLYAFLIFNAQTVLTILYSPHYLAAATLVQGILAFRIVCRLFGGSENGEYLLSQGRVVALVAVGIVAALVNMLLNVTLIPEFGAMGSVIASGAGNLIVNVLGALVVFRMSTNRLQLVFWLKLTFATFVSSFLCSRLFLATNFGVLIASGLLYLGILGWALMVIKPFTYSDYQWLSRINGRLANGLRRFAQAELEPAR
jgi:O-antigen/teichoic acid export membrane protein